MIINLRKFEEKDIPNKVKWINDEKNNQFLHYDLPLEETKTKEWFLKNKDNEKRYDAVIEYNNIPVGLIGLLSIENQTAEYYITIGKQEYKGKGIAKKATELLFAYGFNKLNLKNIYLYTETSNIIAQKLFEKCGFEKKDVIKNSAINRGKLVDRYYYIITKEKYLNSLNKIFPTPILKMSCDDESNNIYIKRDDLIPLSFGGNKARKAINFYNEIDTFGYDSVITYGSSSSNHCRIISNMAASRGLPCYIISPIENNHETYNSKMMKLFGANIKNVPIEKVHDTIENQLQELTKEGKKPYFIPGGGHGNLGTKAYVDCYEEIKKYELENNIFFDYIFLASGTGTTQAGLICGEIINNDKREIIGISIARENPRGRNIVIDSVSEYLKEKDFSIDYDTIDKKTIFIDTYTKSGYGKTDEDIKRTIHKILINYGIPLDPTYTGKAFNGMTEYLKDKKIKNKNILFIHTGGTPLFFDFLSK